MAYFIFLRPAAVRDFNKLPNDVRRRAESAIDRLSSEPRPPGAKKLVGFENEWRLRFGDYRILYTIDDSAKRITIARLARRREVYR